MNKNLLLGGLAVAVLLVLGVSFPKANNGLPGQKGDDGAVGPRGPQGLQGLPGPRGPQGLPGKDAVSLGASVGPDLFLPYLSVNGVLRTYTRVPFSQGTSTVCSVQSPSATSTLVSAKINLTSATSTNVEVNWGRGNGFEDFSTTTLLARAATATPYYVFNDGGAGDGDSDRQIVASTTGEFSLPDASDGNDVIYTGIQQNQTITFAPGDRFNVRFAAKNLDAELTQGDTFNLNGFCTTIFEQW